MNRFELIASQLLVSSDRALYRNCRLNYQQRGAEIQLARKNYTKISEKAHLVQLAYTKCPGTRNSVYTPPLGELLAFFRPH